MPLLGLVALAFVLLYFCTSLEDKIEISLVLLMIALWLSTQGS